MGKRGKERAANRGFAMMFSLTILSALFVVTVSGEKYIGSFTNYYHDIAGKVFAVDDQTLRIEGFEYDGDGPDAFFVVGTNADNPGEGDTVRSIYSDALGTGQKNVTHNTAASLCRS